MAFGNGHLSATGIKADFTLRRREVGGLKPRGTRNGLALTLCRWEAAAAVSLALCSRANFATADGTDHFSVRGIAANDMLNIRAEPNGKAVRLGAIPPGANCIRNLGCQGGISYQEFSTLSKVRQQRPRENPLWCRIEWRGITGRVARRYLAEGKGISLDDPDGYRACHIPSAVMVDWAQSLRLDAIATSGAACRPSRARAALTEHAALGPTPFAMTAARSCPLGVKLEIGTKSRRLRRSPLAALISWTN